MQGKPPSDDTIAKLRARYVYDPETGEIRNRTQPRGSGRIGEIAGSIATSGHRRVGFHGRTFAAHSIAWLLHYGVWPADKNIDHINRIKADNRIANLRLGTESDNACNRYRKRKHQLPKGVTMANGRFVARIMKESRSIHLGCYGSVDQATAAYDRAATRVHGEFASQNSANPATEERAK